MSELSRSSNMFTVVEAERLLVQRLGLPVKPPTKYVIGFKTPNGKLLAMHRTSQLVRVWFQLPAPPAIGGLHLLHNPSNGNSNLNGPLKALQATNVLRAELTSAPSLHTFLDWYLN